MQRNVEGRRGFGVQLKPHHDEHCDPDPDEEGISLAWVGLILLLREWWLDPLVRRPACDDAAHAGRRGQVQ